jgi:hypothetical protein
MRKQSREEAPENTAPSAGSRHRDKKARGTPATTGSPNHPFCFLDLPAGKQSHIGPCFLAHKMQNCAIVSTDLRLYGFASEDLDDLRHAPEVMQRFKAFMTLRKRNWKFSGLAQACKQIRAEYRPL